jgi:hypothetical protein
MPDFRLIMLKEYARSWKNARQNSLGGPGADE